MTDVVDITATEEWRALAAHFAGLRDTTIKELFEAEPDRGATMVLDAADLHLDYSKHRATAETLRLLADGRPSGRRGRTA